MRVGVTGSRLHMYSLFVPSNVHYYPLPYVLMKAIAERGRYESLPIFFCRDAINLQLSMSGFVRANPS